MSAEYCIDTLAEDDRHYILASWKRTFQHATRDQIPASAFFPWQSARIQRILDREPLVLVARDREKPLYLYAFLVAERIGETFVLHWVQTKKDWWGEGIAAALLAEAFARVGQGAKRLIYTHRVPRWEAKARALGFEFVSVERLYGDKEAA